MTCTLRLRYRKLPSIESDIGFDPFRIIWTRYRSKRRNAAADGQAGSEPNGPNRSSGEWDGLPRDRPISEMILAGHRIDIAPVAPVAANRFGKRSAPECRGAFCMPCSGTDTEHTGKAIRTDIRTRNKAKRKASQKRTHRKRSHTQPKANQKNKQSNNRQKNIHTQQPKQKTKNYTYQKETTRVLHPASRLTPENGGIPPFYGCC